MTNPLTLIHPGLLWPDDRGKHIQAHGGGIIKLADTWYWFGEDRSRDNDPGKRYVACYASKDLANWQFRNQVIATADPDHLGEGWILERPKVFYNARTKKFVMYMHIDGKLPGGDSPYGIASVGIATCDTVDGNYQYQRHFGRWEWKAGTSGSSSTTTARPISFSRAARLKGSTSPVYPTIASTWRTTFVSSTRRWKAGPS